MKLLDLFCGAGGCAMGYYRAGFTDITGIDLEPQPRYPFRFVQADALEYVAEHGRKYDMIHASPPCQAYSVTQRIHGNEYPDLVDATRAALQATGKPYVIENVPGAPLDCPVILCGEMFGLKTWRVRWFETNPWLLSPPMPKRPRGMTTMSNRGYSSFANGATHITVAGNNFNPADGAIAMGIDWMTRPELAQAIPPAYTEYIGGIMLELELLN